MASGRRVGDFSLYTGALGIAFLLFKAYRTSGDKSDLALSSHIIKACEIASQGSRYVPFLFVSIFIM